MDMQLFNGLSFSQCNHFSINLLLKSNIMLHEKHCRRKLPDQLLDLTVDALKLLLILLLVLSLVLFQGFQLLRLPHRPVISFRGLFRPVPVHVPDHGCHQLIFDTLECFCKVILVMLHSSAPLPQHPSPQISASAHYSTVL